MTETSDCPSCGAALPPGAACEYCGRIAGADAQAPAPTPSAAELRRRRIDEVASDPRFAGIAARRPRDGAPATGYIASAVFGCFFAGFACIFIVTGFAMNGPAPARFMFLLVPGVFIFVGGSLAVSSIGKLNAYRAAKMTAEPAEVVATRSVTSGRRNRTTTHHVTLETRTGRREFTVPTEVFGTIVAGDTGVAHTKGEWVLSFTRLDDRGAG